METQQQTVTQTQPQAQAQSVPQYNYALGRRIVAMFIDLGIAAYIPFFLIAIVVGVSGMEIPSNEVVQGGLGLLYILYMTTFEAKSGQSIGKKLMKIRVIGTDGRPCSLKQSVIRNLGRIIDGMFLIIVALIVILTPKKQRVGDLLANTIVVKV